MSKQSEDVNAAPRFARMRRATYRHGDLRAALVAEGLELARLGGPDAVVLREVTRRAGVAANAAYRHFADRDALVSAVSVEAQQVVAEEMDREIAAALGDEGGEDASRAQAELDAVGRAYVRFALREPGLFAAAFTVHTDLARAAPASAGAAPRGPYARLSRALDRMAAAGLIAPEDRPGAELAAWSAVHGLAGLMLDGPLRSLDDRQREAAIARVLVMVRNGL
jgi:AcrR family transcriptional regulator